MHTSNDESKLRTGCIKCYRWYTSDYNQEANARNNGMTGGYPYHEENSNSTTNGHKNN